MVEEVVRWIAWKPDGQYLDCTVGQGGHADAILAATGPGSRLVGFDQDEEAVSVARARLASYGARATVLHGNFLDVTRLLRDAQVSEVDGVLFDLGISSAQLGQAARGFSFQAEGPLDMRMDRRAASRADGLIETLSEAALADLIYEFGEERYARRIARAIVRRRDAQPIRTTTELADMIARAVPAAYRHGRIHCATRTFQALRIAVNRELDVVAPALRDVAGVLALGGRIGAIAFHSLEDRIVKQTFKALAAERPDLRVLTKKPLIPTDQEARDNPRSRSAKFRVLERTLSRRAA